MDSNNKTPAPDTRQFLNAVAECTAPFGWQLQSFTRDEEFIVVVALENDPSFEQVVWLYNTEHVSVRCLLVSRAEVPAERRHSIFELCARVNDGLTFGCLEYSFSDAALMFRESADLDACGPLAQVIHEISARVLDLGRRYRDAIEATLKGEPPEQAIIKAEPN
ncbi:MAG TPA: YbjN domain-containing protein [Pyrinomonadaceae bacterium]|nr:YbjN domain-containing protein [Pyrinomonadaceae bacterium]